MQPILPKDFLPIEEAVALINSGTRSDPKVDIKKMALSLDWIEPNHNFRIPLVRLATKEEYLNLIRVTHNPHPNDLIRLGSKYVEIRDGYDMERMKKVVRDHFRDMAGHEYEAQEVRAISSVADDEVAGGVRPRKAKPIAKKGQAIGTGETITTNGANM